MYFAYFSSFRGIAIEMTCCRNQHPSFSSLDTSIFFPQNLPSVVVGHILNPQSDDLLLDMCASPGYIYLIDLSCVRSPNVCGCIA